MLRKKFVFLLVVVSLAAAMIVLLSMASMLKGITTILEEGERGWLGDLVITPNDDRLSIKNIDDVLESLKGIENVEAYAVRAQKSGFVQYKEKRAQPFGVIGIDPLDEKQVSWMHKRPVEGKFLESDEPLDNIVLGIELADFLDGISYDGRSVGIGERVSLLSVDGSLKTYRVGGILDAKIFAPNWSVFVQKRELESFGTEEPNAKIMVKLRDTSLMDDTRQRVQAANPDLFVFTWKETVGYIKDTVAAFRYIANLINSLLLVAAFMIVGIVMYLDVSKRKRQIGIMRSMGASGSFIAASVITKALLHYLAAFIGGGILFSGAYWYMIQYPVPLLIGDFRMVLDRSSALMTFGLLLFASLTGSIVPAWFAMKTKVIDVIRNAT
jgi:putative ABC transport system permease protein